MDKSDLFSEALSKSEALRSRYPEMKTLESIINQISYLIKLERGTVKDKTRLKDIILDVQAAREIENLDLDLAETLYLVAKAAREMN